MAARDPEFFKYTNGVGFSVNTGAVWRSMS
jgi:hypothetical protein